MDTDDNLGLPFHVELRARRDPWSQRTGIVAWHSQEHKIVRGVTWETIPDGMEIQRPSFYVPDEFAQRLMDDLWNAGLRPTEGAGTSGAMAATQRHLEDMRRLVFEIQHGEPVK